MTGQRAGPLISQGNWTQLARMLGAAATLFTACASCSMSPATVPRLRIALGTLAVDSEGCVFIADRTGPVLIQSEPSLTIVRGDRSAVVGQGGRLLARAGDQVQAELVSMAPPRTCSPASPHAPAFIARRLQVHLSPAPSVPS